MLILMNVMNCTDEGTEQRKYTDIKTCVGTSSSLRGSLGTRTAPQGSGHSISLTRVQKAFRQCSQAHGVTQA